MHKKMQFRIEAGVVLFLVAATIGVGIYIFGGGSEESLPEKKVAVVETAEGARAEDTGPTDEQKAQELDEFMIWLDEEAARADEAEAAAVEEQDVVSAMEAEPVVAMVEEEPEARSWSKPR